MARASSVLLSAILTAGFTSVATATAAHAEPAPPCSYSLSPPAVVHIGGADLVSATVTPAGCGAPAEPRMSVACVQRQDNASPIQCNQGRGAAPAQIFAPYQPGATYVSTGRGCGGWMGIAEIAPQCQPLGPITAPL